MVSKVIARKSRSTINTIFSKKLLKRKMSGQKFKDMVKKGWED